MAMGPVVTQKTLFLVRLLTLGSFITWAVNAETQTRHPNLTREPKSAKAAYGNSTLGNPAVALTTPAPNTPNQEREDETKSTSNIVMTSHTNTALTKNHLEQPGQDDTDWKTVSPAGAEGVTSNAGTLSKEDFLTLQERQSHGSFQPASTDNSALSSTPYAQFNRSARAESLVQLETGSAHETSCVEKRFTNTLTDSQGWLEWTSKNQTVRVSWLIDLQPSEGLVLHFHGVHVHVSLTTLNDSLVVYKGCRPDPGRVLLEISGNVLVEPTLVRHHRLLIVLQTHGQKAFVGNELPLTSFKLNYTAKTLTSLPPLTSSGFYECSWPYEIPEAFKCDAVQHCIQGEDEKDCWYERLNCLKGWIPVGNFCLHLVYTRASISPKEATAKCMEGSVNYGAWLYDVNDLKTVARFASLQSNVTHLVLGLKRYQVGIESEGQSHFYRFLWFVDSFIPTTLFNDPFPDTSYQRGDCTALAVGPVVQVVPVECHAEQFYAYACMEHRAEESKLPDLLFPKVTRVPDQSSYKRCSDGSFVLKFHKCRRSELMEVPFQREETNGEWFVANLPLFECGNGRVIHYSLALDGIDDCGDESEEVNHYAYNGSIMCTNTDQVIRASRQCDGRSDCFDNSDELGCGPTMCSHGSVFCRFFGCLPRLYYDRGIGVCPEWLLSNGSRVLASATSEYYNPWLLQTSRSQVDLDGFGMADIIVLKDGEPCPETHFQCRDSDCIPSYLVNNRYFDCPHGDDERVFSSVPIPCPGHYQWKDDERYCNMACPDNCRCEGYAYTCNGLPEQSDRYQLESVRYLDVSGSYLANEFPGFGMTYLKFLNLSNCSLTEFFLFHDRLKVLDLSFNRIKSLSDIFLLGMPFLTHLYLSGNVLFSEPDWSLSVFLAELNVKVLELRNTGITFIGAGAFKNMTLIRELDLTNNGEGLDFHANVFVDMYGLQKLETDEFRLCCSYFHTFPESRMLCSSPDSELSSCYDLFKNDTLRAVVWALSLLALVGSTVLLLFFLLFEETPKRFSSHRTLLMSLCLSDLLMGVYMALLGSVDAFYRGRYLWKYKEWTGSVMCKTVGFLAVVSKEVSALLLCFITADKFLKIRFPGKHRVHMKARSSLVACTVAWSAGLIIAALPMMTTERRLYGQTGVCLPMPFVTHPPTPQLFFPFVVYFNLSLAVSAGCGQALTFLALRHRTQTTTDATPTWIGKPHPKEEHNSANARRFFLVVFADLCCWVSLCTLALVSASTTGAISVSQEAGVWLALFILPISSALRPLFYTLSVVLERRHEQRKRDKLNRMKNELRTHVSSWQCEHARLIVKACIDAKLVDSEWLEDFLSKDE